jgi:type VI secretion system protein ImpK
MKRSSPAAAQCQEWGVRSSSNTSEAFAGTKFFDRLERLLKQPEQQADVIEVYYLCLILGFKGKYHIYLEDQLPGVIENVAEHLRRVGRLRPAALSPHWKATDQPEPPPAAPGLPRWITIGLIAAVGLVHSPTW